MEVKKIKFPFFNVPMLELVMKPRFPADNIPNRKKIVPTKYKKLSIRKYICEKQDHWDNRRQDGCKLLLAAALEVQDCTVVHWVNCCKEYIKDRNPFHCMSKQAE